MKIQITGCKTFMKSNERPPNGIYVCVMKTAGFGRAQFEVWITKVTDDNVSHIYRAASNSTLSLEEVAEKVVEIGNDQPFVQIWITLGFVSQLSQALSKLVDEKAIKPADVADTSAMPDWRQLATPIIKD